MYKLYTTGLEPQAQWRECELIEWKSLNQAIVFCPPFGHVLTKLEYLRTENFMWVEV